MYSIPKSIVPFRYHITRFMAIQWCLDGLAENFAKLLTENVISGLVPPDKKNRGGFQ